MVLPSRFFKKHPRVGGFSFLYLLIPLRFPGSKLRVASSQLYSKLLWTRFNSSINSTFVEGQLLVCGNSVCLTNLQVSNGISLISSQVTLQFVYFKVSLTCALRWLIGVKLKFVCYIFWVFDEWTFFLKHHERSQWIQ